VNTVEGGAQRRQAQPIRQPKQSAHPDPPAKPLFPKVNGIVPKRLIAGEIAAAAGGAVNARV
jgi:hypothetical protein